MYIFNDMQKEITIAVIESKGVSNNGNAPEPSKFFNFAI